MQQMNLHKNKLIALAEAALALIGMFLVWTVEKYPAQLLQQFNQQFGQQDQGQVANAMTTSTQNGFNSWGWLALIGILVVIVGSLVMNHMSLDYDKNSRMVVIAGFTLIVLGALIYFFRLNSVAKEAMQVAQQRGIAYSASSGMGLWSTLVAGVIGIAWVSGLLNKLNMSPATSQQGHPQHPYQQNNPYQQPQYGPQPPYGQQPPYQQQPGNYPPQQYPQQPYQQQPPYPQQPPQQSNYPQQPPYPPDQQQGYPQNPPAGNQQYPQQQQAPSNYQQGPPPPPPPPPANPYL